MPAHVPDIDAAFVDQPPHEPCADVETLGYLIDCKQAIKRAVVSKCRHRGHPSNSDGWAWTVMDRLDAPAARRALGSGFMMRVFASFLLLVLVSGLT
jgi:hypothetical protein